MKIGVISNTDVCLPLLQFLKTNGADVALFFGSTRTFYKNKDNVIHFCKSALIDIETEHDEKNKVYAWLSSYNPDLVFIIGYRYKIDVSLLPVIKDRLFNIHFGKLPEYRGGNPVFWQLKHGCKTIALTFHKLTDQLDAGPIIWQREYNNEEHFNYSSVHYMFSNFLVQGVIDIVAALQQGQGLRHTVQDQSKAKTYNAPALKDVLIDWNAMNALEVCNLIKACTSWNYGAITSVNRQEIKVLDAFVTKVELTENKAGTIVDTGNEIVVKCKDESFLAITFFNMNDVYFPARFAEKYGLKKGVRLGT